jgi:hypothetical protein
MTIILSVIGFAALFALAAGLRSRAGCTHDCGACGGACGLERGEPK